MITIIVNGKSETLERAIDLLELLESRQVDLRRGVAIGHNGEVVHRDAWACVTLKDGDVLDIVHMVGGG